MPPTRRAPQDRRPKASTDGDVDLFEWTSPKNVTVRMHPASELTFGDFEDAMSLGELQGMLHLVRAACASPADHEALRSLRMADVEPLFAAWNGGATPGESQRSSG